VDGDTIKIQKDGEVVTLRLIGIDTPETKDTRKPVQCFGKEASAKASEILSGQKVTLEYDPSNTTDKYGRTLAYVFREDGLDFNLGMVAIGYAHSYKTYPHPRLDEFNKAEQEAREKSLGLWASSSCSGDTEQPAEKPATTSPPTTGSGGGTGTGTNSGSSGTACFATCKAAKAAGAGPFYKGDKCYSSKQDRDGDGVACE
jgi:micrococcal nuclease